MVFCKFEENAPVPGEASGTNWRGENVLYNRSMRECNVS
jgi:hypothetical protein